MAAQTSTREGKSAVITTVKGRFDKATSAVFLDYKGMTVEQATTLRASFRKAGVEYKVVKNTLVKQALKDTAYGTKLNDVLTGMTGIAWCYEDPSAAAKVVKQFKKDGGEAGQKLVVKGGLIEGEVLSAARVEKAGIVHARVGKVSFAEGALAENARALINALVRAKPSTAKGTYVRSITISSTMGPGVKIDTGAFVAGGAEET